MFNCILQNSKLHPLCLIQNMAITSAHYKKLPFCNVLLSKTIIQILALDEDLMSVDDHTRLIY